MADLSTQPYKGARDFYPEDMRIQRHIFNIWRTISERYGYEEYDAPYLELTELYKAKTGDEIVDEQAYTFTDRGGREVTIRPEMTPSLARMVAGRQQELAYPLRWYSIPNCWRYERPQRGRGREFWQLNVDLIGVESTEADLEVIKVADSIMRAFGATAKDYTVHLNSRKLLSLLLGEHLGLDVNEAHLVSKLIDRKAKMSDQAFATQAESIMGGATEKLMHLLSIENIDGLPTTVVESGVVEELRQLLAKLASAGVDNVKFDLTLMRGLDYYTGTVFEVFDEDPVNKRSLFGGGRYDELTGIFGAPNVPAVGFGLGDITMRDFLETHKLIPELPSTAKVSLIVMGDNSGEAKRLANTLRKGGVNVAVDITGRKTDAQLKSALKNKVPFAIFLGDAEAKTQKYTLKNLVTQTEAKLDESSLLKHLS